MQLSLTEQIKGFACVVVASSDLKWRRFLITKGLNLILFAGNDRNKFQ